MEYLSTKSEQLRQMLKDLDKPKDSSEMKLYSALIDLVDEVTKQQDLLGNKLEELEEFIENMSMDVHDIQELLLKNLDLDALEKPEPQEGDDEERPDDFYTLQCPFCEELFFIERDELDLEVDCPFCGKKVVAADNLVKK